MRAKLARVKAPVKYYPVHSSAMITDAAVRDGFALENFDGVLPRTASKSSGKMDSDGETVTVDINSVCPVN